MESSPPSPLAQGKIIRTRNSVSFTLRFTKQFRMLADSVICVVTFMAIFCGSWSLLLLAANCVRVLYRVSFSFFRLPILGFHPFDFVGLFTFFVFFSSLSNVTLFLSLFNTVEYKVSFFFAKHYKWFHFSGLSHRFDWKIDFKLNGLDFLHCVYFE